MLVRIRYWIAVLAVVLCIIYTLVLAVQLRPLKAELPDCTAHALGCVAGLITVGIQLFIVQGVSLSESLSAEQQISDSSTMSASATLGMVYAIEATVLLHFIFTSGELCMHSILRPNDPEILKHYHDEFAPLVGSFKLKAESM